MGGPLIEGESCLRRAYEIEEEEEASVTDEKELLLIVIAFLLLCFRVKRVKKYSAANNLHLTYISPHHMDCPRVPFLSVTLVVAALLAFLPSPFLLRDKKGPFPFLLFFPLPLSSSFYPAFLKPHGPSRISSFFGRELR